MAEATRTDLVLARAHLTRCEIALDFAKDQVDRIKTELVLANQDVEAKAQALEQAKAKCRELARITKIETP